MTRPQQSPPLQLGEPEELLRRWQEGALLNREEMNALVKHLEQFRQNVYSLFYGLAANNRPCTKCGAMIWFLPTGKMDPKNEKPILMPVSPSGQSHFKDCPHASEFHRPQRS